MTPSAAISVGGAGRHICLIDRCGIRFGRSDHEVFECQLQLFDLALDLFRGLAKGLLPELGDAQPEGLNQLVMGAQDGGYLGVLRLQSRDYRLQRGGVIREILGIAGHATDYHTSGQNAIKTSAFRRINHPTRAGGAPQSGLRQSIPSHNIAN